MSRSKGRLTVQKQKSPLKRFTRLIIFAMVVSAVAQELSKPAAERTWHGQVWRFVPYDFRLPTWERVRHSWWAPDNPKSSQIVSSGSGGLSIWDASTPS
jgi:hypothetical protein